MRRKRVRNETTATGTIGHEAGLADEVAISGARLSLQPSADERDSLTFRQLVTTRTSCGGGLHFVQLSEFSFPYGGQTNTYWRRFRLVVAKPETIFK